MEFEWHHVSMIVDETDFANKLVRTSLEKEMKSTSSNGYPMYVDIQSFTYRNFEGDIIEKKIDFEKVLKASSRTARGTEKILLIGFVSCRITF